MAISVEHCRYASDYNWNNRIWDRNADLNIEGRAHADQNQRRDSQRAVCHSRQITSIKATQKALAETGKN